MTRAVSKSGISSSSTGAATTESTFDSVVLRLSDDKVNADSVTPMNRLPLSPMKIDAGGKLKTRKPSIAPSSREAYEVVGMGSSTEPDPASRAATAMTAIPTQRPSMLSRRLNALVTPTIHKIVMSESRACDSIQRRW